MNKIFVRVSKERRVDQRIGVGTNRFDEDTTQQVLADHLKRLLPGVVREATTFQRIGKKSLKLARILELQEVSDELLTGQIAVSKVQSR